MRSTYQRSNEATPTHGGRKGGTGAAVARQNSGLRSKSAEEPQQHGLGRRRSSENLHAQRDHLHGGAAATADGGAAGKNGWAVNKLPLNELPKASKRIVDRSGYNKERKVGRGVISKPLHPGDLRATGPIPTRDGNFISSQKRLDLTKHCSSESPAEEAEPLNRRRMTEHLRSCSVEYQVPRKHVVSRKGEITSLWGAAEPSSATPERPRGLRQVLPRSPTSPASRNSPYATYFDEPEASGLRPKMQPLALDYANGASAAVVRCSTLQNTPYDNHCDIAKGPQRMEAGARNEFRPRTRIFSSEDSQAKLFGT
ncbi:hypothetical protein DIPPA_24092 [Diplonema papillatum]|nr:hypothetical protein DIPPA_24092 [Diplonema papillatum]